MLEGGGGSAETEFEVAERLHRPCGVHTHAELRAERRCLGGVFAAARLASLSRFEAGQTGERYREFAPLAGFASQSDRLVERCLSRQPLIAGGLVACDIGQECRQDADRSLLARLIQCPLDQVATGVGLA